MYSYIGPAYFTRMDDILSQAVGTCPGSVQTVLDVHAGPAYFTPMHDILSQAVNVWIKPCLSENYRRLACLDSAVSICKMSSIDDLGQTGLVITPTRASAARLAALARS